MPKKKDPERSFRARKAYWMYHSGEAMSTICAFLGLKRRSAYVYVEEGRILLTKKVRDKAASELRDDAERVAQEVVRIARQNQERVEVFVEMHYGVPVIAYSPVRSARSQKASLTIGIYDQNAEPEMIIADIEASGLFQ